MALTHKQKAYCKARADGASYADAYIKAYGDGSRKRKTATDNAYNMENKCAHSTEIKQKIEDLRRRAEDKSILQRQEREVLLSDIALSDGEKAQDRLRALDILARMHGDYTDRIRIDGSVQASLTYTERLEAIRQAMEES